MSEYEYFDFCRTDSVAKITMNHPPLNVMNNPMMAEFNHLLETIQGDENISGIVIGAAGKAFSAGVDVADHAADKVAEMVCLFHGIFRKLASTDALTIAAVNGAALGGGCELACFCDIVLASDRSKFAQPEVMVGVFPPVAAAVLPLQIGTKKAVELTALGATIGAEDAQRIGLVNQVFEAADFTAQVESYIGGLRKLSRPVVRMAKRATMLIAKEQILSHLERNEQIYLKELMKLEDSHEGIAAFMEKREPAWTHA
ncbi:MAG: enoyl-CoA hydratase/isomerase family protein [Planctomycetota bacterium]|jgi:cyclohexa-1,5-dienecarbonyl-CoA hydratase